MDSPVVRSGAPSTFAELTAVEPIDGGRYAVDIDPSSFIVRGPNGGYLAAQLLRAGLDRVRAAAGQERAPRSLTIHYPLPPAAGPAIIETEIIRVGRSVATVSIRMLQEGRPVAVALLACSPPWTGPEWSDAPRPEVPAFDDVVPHAGRLDLPYLQWWEQRRCLGAEPFTGSDVAETGGWLRTRPAAVVDAPVVAAATDAWPPSVFPRLREPAAAPTIDLTIHFRRTLPHPGMAPEDPLLVRFVSRLAAEGFFEEDGAIWAPDGTLLAQSRQLAIITPM